jgi:hypothetical protein
VPLMRAGTSTIQNGIMAERKLQKQLDL